MLTLVVVLMLVAVPTRNSSYDILYSETACRLAGRFFFDVIVFVKVWRLGRSAWELVEISSVVRADSVRWSAVAAVVLGKDLVETGSRCRPSGSESH